MLKFTTHLLLICTLTNHMYAHINDEDVGQKQYRKHVAASTHWFFDIKEVFYHSLDPQFFQTHLFDPLWFNNLP